MRLLAGRTLIVLVALSLSLAACGKKTPPRWIVSKSPGAPAGVQVHYRPDRISLQWKAPEGEVAVEDYVVSRSKDGGQPVRIAVVKGTKYLDRDIDPNSSYTYEVFARAGEGKAGPTASAARTNGNVFWPGPNVTRRWAPGRIRCWPWRATARCRGEPIIA